jgi:hypothetical protein
MASWFRSRVSGVIPVRLATITFTANSLMTNDKFKRRQLPVPQEYTT